VPKKRSVPVIALPSRMHIYCEGEKTEPSYIRKYIRKNFAGDRRRELVIVEPTKKNTPVQLVEEAIRHQRRGDCPDGDIFWVVFDRESVAKYDNSLHVKAEKKARDNGINIAISNVCFELWLLLHFKDNTAAYTCFDNLMAYSELKAELLKLGIKKYEKGALGIFDMLSREMISAARRRATSMNAKTLQTAPPGRTARHELNPYTDVHLLLDAIDSFR